MSLVDLATTKRAMSILTTNSDFRLSLLINDQSQMMLDETGRPSFDLQTYSELRDGLGVDTMQLANWPVQSITSLTKNGVLVKPSTAWNVPGYVFDALGKITLLFDTFSCGPGMTFDRKNVTAVYVAGYPTITITSELQTIPAAPGPPASITWPPANQIWVNQPNWRADGGVVFFGGAALTPSVGPPLAGQYFLLGGGGYLFNAADQTKQVQITYTAAGYPLDLVGAVIRMVSLRYYQQGHEDLKSVKIAEGTTTYSKEDYPRDVIRVIKKYKKYFHTPGF